MIEIKTKSSEFLDFEFMRDKALHSVDFATGLISTKSTKVNKVFYDVGSVNEDGYIRLWCNGRLRMKHRFLYFLFHGELPEVGEEIDHWDNDRSNNSISNLRVLTKGLNNKKSYGSKGRLKSARIPDTIIEFMCRLLSETTLSDLDIADTVGTSRPTVRDVKTRRTRVKISTKYTWPHRGY